MMSKSRLAILLSKLEVFKDPKVMKEQYPTDSEVAASMLWNAYVLGDIEGRVIADLGCGTGILGIGALLLGADKVSFIDMDKGVLEVAKSNILKVESESLEHIGLISKAEFICKDIQKVNIKAGVVLENPPFGTKVKHSDRLFLEKALETAPIVYSFHKSESKTFLEGFAAKKNARITHIWDFEFPLKASFEFHRRQIHRINVSCFRFEK
ncbi:MAG: METTL5 family protein [Nanoarchaeota archaeon]